MSQAHYDALIRTQLEVLGHWLVGPVKVSGEHNDAGTQPFRDLQTRAFRPKIQADEEAVFILAPAAHVGEHR